MNETKDENPRLAIKNLCKMSKVQIKTLNVFMFGMLSNECNYKELDKKVKK